MNQCLRPAVVFQAVLLIYSRRQVDDGDIAKPVEFSGALTENRHVALEFCGRISLVIDGYNDDPRELFEVPQIRAYLQRLYQEWPYWFFFLSQVDESIKLLGSCLCDTNEVVPGVTSIELDQLERSLTRHFGAMDQLREQLNLPEDLCGEVADGVISLIQNAAVEQGISNPVVF